MGDARPGPGPSRRPLAGPGVRPLPQPPLLRGEGEEETSGSPSPLRGGGWGEGSSPQAAVVEMRNVSVRYGDRAVLDNVSWTVRAGERWAVLGPNGSGKTTLLSLICADHPQAYANDLRLFGVQRGSGESIWDIKKRIGL